jgi:hypothetical protein
LSSAPPLVFEVRLLYLTAGITAMLRARSRQR